MARWPTPGNWHDKTPAERRAWIEEREWSPGGLRSIMADEAEANRMDDEDPRSEEHSSALQSPMRISYAVFCLKNKTLSHEYITSQTRYNTPSPSDTALLYYT